MVFEFIKGGAADQLQLHALLLLIIFTLPSLKPSRFSVLSSCFHMLLFPPCPSSPDSAVRLLSPTGNSPESKSAKQSWRILGTTHAWWRTCWGGTTPPAPSTSKAVSTHSQATSEEAHILLSSFHLPADGCKNMHEDQLSTRVVLTEKSVEQCIVLSSEWNVDAGESLATCCSLFSTNCFAHHTANADDRYNHKNNPDEQIMGFKIMCTCYRLIMCTHYRLKHADESCVIWCRGEFVAAWCLG